MSDLDLLLAVAGVAVTVMVISGMVLITPRGQVEAVGDTRSADDDTDSRPGPLRADSADTLRTELSAVDGALTTPTP